MTSTTPRPRYDIAALKERADIVAEVADRTGPGKYAGAIVTFSCPNPSHADRKPSFTVNSSTGRFRCWSQCDKGGDVIELVQWLDGRNLQDAIAYLAGRYGLSPDTSYRAPVRKGPPPPAAPRVVTQAADTCRPHPDPEVAARIMAGFLAGRGWTAEVAAEVGLSVVLDLAGRPRVRFPFYREGVALLWQDRAVLDGQTPKWLTPAGAVLYPHGLDVLDRFGPNIATCPPCPIVQAPAVWVVEGPADAVTLRSLWPDLAAIGLPGTKSWQAHYADALAGLPVVIVTDNDPAGQALREQVTADLRPKSLPINVVVPEPYNDLGEWYLATGWERFAAELIEITDTAEAASVGVTL
jgi:hypothetical protein